MADRQPEAAATPGSGATMPSPGDGRPPERLAVVVPAHNEARLIGRCLSSLLTAVRRAAGSGVDPRTVHLLVVLDACTDGSEAVVAAFPGVRTIRVDHRRVGSARRAGAEHLLGAGLGHGWWLASTDADSTVPPDWLCTMVALARAGADLVLGTVHPAPGLPADLLRRWRAGYHGADGHRHVHGANLGIAGVAYRRLGGWPEAASSEDAVLVRRAEAAGLSIIRIESIPVRTSARLRGRAPDGFAAHLAALVPPAGAAATRSGLG